MASKVEASHSWSSEVFMGVFTHLWERNFYSEFAYPMDLDLGPLIKQLKHGKKPDIQPINTFNYTYKKLCLNKCPNGQDVDLLFVIKSAMNNFQRRRAIRATWGEENRFSDISVRRVFLLGTGPNTDDIQRSIDAEDEEFGDIVQSDFMDSYYNNTLKTMSGFRWVVEHCPRARYTVFTDDDMYISTRNILLFLQSPSSYPDVSDDAAQSIVRDGEHRERSLKQQVDLEDYDSPKHEDDGQLSFDLEGRLGEDSLKLFAGFLFHSSPLRHKSSKWYVSLEEYPFNMWPPYITAGAYALSRSALIDLYYGSYYTKYFRFDDIFLALVAQKANVKPMHCPEFHSYWKKGYSKDEYRHVIASHGYDDPDELVRVWNEQKSLGYA
nr:EOG090X07IA [Macrothrix elegans]